MTQLSWGEVAYLFTLEMHGRGVDIQTGPVPGWLIESVGFGLTRRRFMEILPEYRRRLYQEAT